MKQSPLGMSRRNLLLGSVALAALPAVAAAAEKAAPASAHHMNHGPDKSLQAVIDAALDCVKTGTACREHCVMMFQMGDNSMQDCYPAVSELVISCAALADLSAVQAKHLREFMQVCVQSCEACETVCGEHKDVDACRACAESCKTCIKACKAYLGH